VVAVIAAVAVTPPVGGHEAGQRQDQDQGGRDGQKDAASRCVGVTQDIPPHPKIPPQRDRLVEASPKNQLPL